MKPHSGFHPEVLFKRVSNFTLIALIAILTILPGFRKDSRKPFKNYVVLVSLDAFPLQKRPELVTLYFDEPNATSHDFGPVSPETGKVVERLDSRNRSFI